MQLQMFQIIVLRGTIFQGEPGNTKKQAKMNGAKIALQRFKDSKSLATETITFISRTNLPTMAIKL